jgi:hypothetical protein
MQQAVDRLIPGDDRAAHHDQDDDDTRQIFHPAEAVGEPGTGVSPGEQEGDPQGHCRRRVADVVDSIGEQRDTARQHDDTELQGGRHPKDHK